MIGEKNHSEDVSFLIESIEWKQVSFETILEFILKFSKNVEKYEYEHILLRLLDAKFSDAKTGLHGIISKKRVIKTETVVLRKLTVLSRITAEIRLTETTSPKSY